MPKDACYNKVVSRYGPKTSAYRSGAMAKCRKVGVANWGNKSKKKVTSFHRNGDVLYNNICTALGFSSSSAFRSDPLASWKI